MKVTYKEFNDGHGGGEISVILEDGTDLGTELLFEGDEEDYWIGNDNWDVNIYRDENNKLRASLYKISSIRQTDDIEVEIIESL